MYFRKAENYCCLWMAVTFQGGGVYFFDRKKNCKAYIFLNLKPKYQLLWSIFADRPDIPSLYGSEGYVQVSWCRDFSRKDCIFERFIIWHEKYPKWLLIPRSKKVMKILRKWIFLFIFMQIRGMNYWHGHLTEKRYQNPPDLS